MFHFNLILTKIMIVSHIRLCLLMFPLKKPNAVPKLIFHVTHLSIFQETQKLYFFKSFTQVLHCPRFQLSHHWSKDHV